MTTKASEREAYEKEARELATKCFMENDTVDEDTATIAAFLAKRDAKRVPLESEAELHFANEMSVKHMEEAAHFEMAWFAEKKRADKAEAKCREMEKAKNNAYSERNRMVAALSKLFPASLERHDGDEWEDDWRWVVFIDLPTGQASWHLHDSEVPNFGHLAREVGRKWDGHTTDDKYARLAALAPLSEDQTKENK
jgi:hypothetical protein